MSESSMTWEQKLEACQAIGDISLRMRKQGDWYVDHRGVEKKTGCCLEGGCVTGATTPEEAVEQHWKWLTSVKGDETIVVKAYSDNREEYRWTGFMWKRWD